MLDDAEFKFKIYGLLKYKLRNYAAKTCTRSAVFSKIRAVKVSEGVDENTTEYGCTFYGSMTAENTEEGLVDGDFCPVQLYDDSADNECSKVELKIDMLKYISADELAFIEKRLDGTSFRDLATEYGITRQAAEKRFKKICSTLIPLGESLRQCA